MPKNKKSWYRMEADASTPKTANITINDEIGYWGVSAKQFDNDLNALGDIDVINLTLNSPGGEVFDGIFIFNALKMHKATVNVYISGLAASMGSIIALAGDTVSMSENSFFMIHKPSIWGYEDTDFDQVAEEFKKEAELLRQIEGNLINIYKDATGLPEEDIRVMLAETTWMDASQAKEKGFITAITEPVKVAANFAALERAGIEMPEDVRKVLNCACDKKPKPDAKEEKPTGLKAKIMKMLGKKTPKAGTTLSDVLNGVIDGMATDTVTRDDIIQNMADASGDTVDDVTMIIDGTTECPTQSQLSAFSTVLNTTLDALKVAAEADGCDFATAEAEEDVTPAEAKALLPEMMAQLEAVQAQLTTHEATIAVQAAELVALGKKPAAEPTAKGSDATNKITPVVDATEQGSVMAAAQNILHSKS